MRWTLLFAAAAAVSINAPLGAQTDPATTSRPAADGGRNVQARDFVQQLSRGRFSDAARAFDKNLARRLTPEALRVLWRRIGNQSGPLRSFGKPYRKAGQEDRVVYIPAEFGRGRRTFKIVFDAENRISGFWLEGETPAPDYRLPSYARPNRYDERDVSFGKAPWTVKGKLTMPKSGDPAPVVVLVHGSGAHDEDETLLSNKPFKDLATGLSSNGIAVLRYQKRTFAHRRRLAGRPTITLHEEVIDDAVAALAFARSQPGIDKKGVYLLGHSIGGSLAPHIAREAGEVAGLILMAGSPRDTFDLLEEQTSYIASLPRANQSQNERGAAEIRRAVRAIRAGADPAELWILDISATYWVELGQLSQDSIYVAKSLSSRMLVLGGGRDYQVTKTDFELYKSGLAGRKGAQFRWYDDLNHLFFRGIGMATPEDYEKPGHVDEAVVRDIAAWIKSAS